MPPMVIAMDRRRHLTEWVGLPQPAWLIDSPGLDTRRPIAAPLQPNNHFKTTCQYPETLAPVVHWIG